MKSFKTNAKAFIVAISLLIMSIAEFLTSIVFSVFVIGLILWVLQLISFPLLPLQIIVSLFVAYCLCKWLFYFFK